MSQSVISAQTVHSAVLLHFRSCGDCLMFNGGSVSRDDVLDLFRNDSLVSIDHSLG